MLIGEPDWGMLSDSLPHNHADLDYILFTAKSPLHIKMRGILDFKHTYTHTYARICVKILFLNLITYLAIKLILILIFHIQF